MKPEFLSFPIIYSTGVYLKPAKTYDWQGKELWYWFVAQFEEECFGEDGENILAHEYSASYEELIEKIPDESIMEDEQPGG